MSKKLSVIIPMYNVEKYINKCIQSVLDQTLEDIEIIIIDDGSKDKSYSIALEYKKKYPEQIILLKQVNKGQASARNVGLSKARGKYIAFVDSDDFIDKEMYSKLVSEAEKFDLDIVQCNYLNWYSNSSNKNFPYKFKNIGSNVYDGVTYFNYEPSLSPCDKIFRKQFLNDINFCFEEGRYAEDVLEISKAFYFARRVKYLNEIMYYYRRNSFNSTRNSIELQKTIKLGVDKIFIAYKLNEFRKSKNWNGSVRKIIVRNIIGAFIKKEILNKEYRNKVIDEFKKRKAFKILVENFNVVDIISFIPVGVNKLILKQDV